MTTRILVVEDDPPTLRLFTELLRSQGYDVEGAADALTALGKVDANCPNVVLSDLALPGMDGIELLKAIRQRRPGCTPFFIIMSGYATVQSAFSAVEEGVDAYATKPIEPDGLFALLASRGFPPTIEPPPTTAKPPTTTPATT